jgi:FimV-like protein
MGAALDPENPLFGSGMTAPAPAAAKAEADLDFNLDAPASPSAAQAPAGTDFEIEVPAAEPQSARDDKPAIDFAIEVPRLDVPPPAVPAPRAAPNTAAPLDFKLDLGALDLSLDEKKPAAAGSGGAHDPHWHDVEAKFDLAKAYQEMGEKSRAADALKEAMQEGDSDQQERARRLLDSMGTL